MKLATYHKMQGDDVTFYKGNASDVAINESVKDILNYFTDSNEFFSTQYEESTEGIILNEPQKIRYVIDYQVRNWKRILGVVQETDSSSSNELENDDIPF